MGIDAHPFNFIKLQSRRAPLGRVLTIGRQQLSVDARRLGEELAAVAGQSLYCEPVLTALGAESVASVDYSDYEQPSYVADLGRPITMSERFDTIVDAGSLEHIFDVATAFRNLIELCEVGGRIIHSLPVNDLNGHGFYQFCSDLIFAIYSERNGFADTEVYYASNLDPSVWHKMPPARPGVRVEVLSIEPIILLSVARKVAKVDQIDVTQPFYAIAWEQGDGSLAKSATPLMARMKRWVAPFAPKGSKWRNAFRDVFLLGGLTLGLSPYSLRRRALETIDVDQVLNGRGS
jgi:SAM-dependent methyltransferase